MSGEPVGPQLLRRFNLLAVAMLLLLCVFIAYDRWREYRAAVEFAEILTTRVARTVEEHAAQAFETIERSLRTLVALRPEVMPGDPDTLRTLYRELRREALAHPEIDNVAILAADGTVLYEEIPARRSELRAYLAAAREAAQGILEEIRFGNVSVHPATGDRYIAMALTIPAPEPGDAATLVAAVDPDFFQAFYDSIDVGAGGGIGLFRRDGTLLVRRPFSDELVNRIMTGPLFSTHLPRAESGTFRERVQTDDAVRVVSYRALKSYPIVVGVGLRQSDLLAGWYRSLGVSVAVFAVLAALLSIPYAIVRRLIVAHVAVAESLRESEHRFAELAANVPGIVFRRVLHPDGRVSFPYISEGVRRIYGLSPEDIRASPDLFLAGMLPPYRDEFRQSLRRSAETGAVWRFEFEVEDAEGRRTWVRAVGRPSPLPDGSTAWDGLLVDISDAKRLQADLRRAVDAAERASRAKSQFLASMSHELRTPLNAIIGFSEVLRDRDERLTPERRREYLDDIRLSGQHLLALVNDILDLSRIEAGTAALNESWVNLAEIVRDSVRMLDGQLTDADLRLDIRIPDDLPALYADASAVRQVLLNVLSNAVKFTPRGGGIAVAAQEAPSGDVVLTVNDTGVGLAPGIAEIAFEPFQTGRDVYTRSARHGVGLGLAICHRLIRLHGGDIGIAGAPGGGTVVTVTFPASRVRRL